MSLPTQERQDVKKRWFQRKIIWLIGALILLGTGLVVFNYARLHRTQEVGGRFTLEASGDARFYVNDEFVGNKQVSFTLLQLFGDADDKSVAIKLADLRGAATAELVSGSGAKVLHSTGIGGLGSAFIDITGESILIRRVDGTLDQVLVFIFDWTPPNQTTRRYLLPVRIRKGASPSRDLFIQAESGITAARNPAYLRIIGRSPDENNITIKFTPALPPAEFAEEIKTKGLWEPAGKK
jgi:hypothetical protein